MARFIGLENVQGPRLQTAKFRGDLSIRVRSEPVVRLTKYQIIEIAFQINGIEQVAQNTVISKSSVRKIVSVSSPYR